MANPTLTIRLPVDLKAALVEAAHEDDRSITDFVVNVIKMAITLQRGDQLNAVRQMVRRGDQLNAVRQLASKETKQKGKRS